jgi:hypothetical protein
VLFSLDGEARSLLDEDHLRELGIEKHRLDVEVVDTLVLRCYHGQQ